MLPNQWNNSVAQASLAPVASVPEYYEELWWFSGSYGNGGNANAGTYFLAKGNSSINTGSSSSAVTLLTLNSSWPTSQKYALELAMLSANSGTTVNAELWDLTSGNAVSGSQVSTTSSTMTVLRSGQFILIPSHKYGVTIWAAAGASQYVTDASLIIFPQ